MGSKGSKKKDELERMARYRDLVQDVLWAGILIVAVICFLKNGR